MHIQKLKVNRKKLVNVTPCTVEMAAVVSCWASLGIDHATCSNQAKALAACMAQPPPKKVF
ncbi:hypothetical protein IWQ62_001079 [Dispira parvispora]|uniref:Uncharacterized protein n=1 Tax=Dispira parvispora TaxID=1520584 RepID=A0A9W8AYT8_9FUNG|nr:hypothetical protein IWQ62_001079 [Dispira parvispora]